MGRRKRRERKYSRLARGNPPRIHRRKHPVTIQVQGRVVRLSLRTTPVKGARGVRGKIFSFTPQSRKRMLEITGRLDWDNAGFVCFVTLGYPDRDGPPSLAQYERDRQAFFKRLKRMHPGASAIWRREHEPRKSGKFVGTPFPHYHGLFFGLPFLHYDVLNEIWREVLGYEEYVRTEIKQVHSWKQALYYVAKYMAKPEFCPAAERGKSAEQADAPPAPDSSLVYVTYLTAAGEAKEQAHEVSELPSIGKSWGIHNRHHLPWGKRRVRHSRAGAWLAMAKRLARERWKGVEFSQSMGFTLFVEDADKVFDELCDLRKPKP